MNVSSSSASSSFSGLNNTCFSSLNNNNTSSSSSVSLPPPLPRGPHVASTVPSSSSLTEEHKRFLLDFTGWPDGSEHFRHFLHLLQDVYNYTGRNTTTLDMFKVYTELHFSFQQTEQTISALEQDYLSKSNNSSSANNNNNCEAGHVSLLKAWTEFGGRCTGEEVGSKPEGSSVSSGSRYSRPRRRDDFRGDVSTVSTRVRGTNRKATTAGGGGGGVPSQEGSKA